MKLMPFAAMKSNAASVEKKYIFFIFNPLTAKDKIPRPGNLTFLWTWILMWEYSEASQTHAALCNTLSSNKTKIL